MTKTKFLRGVAAAALVIAAVSGALYAPRAFAIYNDQTRIFNKRFDPDGYHPSYYRFQLNWNDTNISTGQQFGALGALEFIKSIDCYVSAPFNAGGNNFITIGTTAANANEIVASSGNNAAIVAGTIGMYHLTSAAGLGLNVTSPNAVNLYVKYAQTGAAAGEGTVTCVMEFVPNNDM